MQQHGHAQRSEYADEIAGEGLSTIIRAEVFIVLIVWGAIIGMIVWHYAFQSKGDALFRRWGETADLLPSWAPHGMQSQQGSPSKERPHWSWQPVMRGLTGTASGRATPAVGMRGAQRSYGEMFGGDRGGPAPPSRLVTPEPRAWAHQQQLSARHGYPAGVGGAGGGAGTLGVSSRQGFGYGGFPGPGGAMSGGNDAELSGIGPGRPPGLRMNVGAGMAYANGFQGGEPVPHHHQQQQYGGVVVGGGAGGMGLTMAQQRSASWVG